MNTLAFDTSGPVLSVALQCDENPIQEKIHYGAMEHMEHLLVFVDELLKSEKRTLAQIDRFIINRGPGSFTGLRIGFSFLKGFLAANKKPCFGCDSPDALAERIPVNGKYLAVALDAFRSKFYVKIFESRAVAPSAQSKSKTKYGWQPISPCRALTFEEALRSIPPGALVTGDALRRHTSVFDKGSFILAAEEFWYPHASSLIRLQKSRPEAVQKLISSEDLLPVYLRLSEPEERKKENYV